MGNLKAYFGMLLVSFLLLQKGHAKVCVDIDTKDWKSSFNSASVTLNLEYISNKEQDDNPEKSDGIVKTVEVPIKFRSGKIGKCYASLNAKDLKSVRGSITVTTQEKEYGVQCSILLGDKVLTEDRDFLSLPSRNSSLIVTLSGNRNEPRCSLKTK